MNRFFCRSLYHYSGGGNGPANLAAGGDKALNEFTINNTGNLTGSNLFVQFETTTSQSGFQQALIDSVVVQVIPEPSTFATLLGGVGALVLLRRPRA